MLGLAEGGPQLLLLDVGAEGQVRLRPLQRLLLVTAGRFETPDARAERLILRGRAASRLARIIQLALSHAELDLRPGQAHTSIPDLPALPQLQKRS